MDGLCSSLRVTREPHNERERDLLRVPSAAHAERIESVAVDRSTALRGQSKRDRSRHSPSQRLRTDGRTSVQSKRRIVELEPTLTVEPPVFERVNRECRGPSVRQRSENYSYAFITKCISILFSGFEHPFQKTGDS